LTEDWKCPEKDSSYLEKQLVKMLLFDKKTGGFLGNHTKLKKGRKKGTKNPLGEDFGLAFWTKIWYDMHNALLKV